MIETELCSFCGEVKESITHLFFNCSYVKTIWIILHENLLSLCNLSVSMNIENAIFGYHNCSNEEESRTVNLITLLLKQFIYSCKCNKSIPRYVNFIEYVRYTKSVDMFSSYLLPKKKSDNLKNTWNILSNLL